MPSIREVARRAGVSPATVSRTFSTPDLINIQTQQRVLEAARQLNYEPPRHRAARSRGTAAVARQESIGFQFFAADPADVLQSNTFYAPVLAGAQSEASLLGLNLLLHTTDRHSLSLELPKMVLDQTIGGLLLVGTADPAVLATFAAHIPHIILVDNRDETGKHEGVLSDGFGGAYAATRYLLDLGHRRIGFFLPEQGVTTFQDRLRGYICALFEAGILPDRALVLEMPGPNDTVREDALFAYLSKGTERPTALLTANDHYGLMALRACRRAGLRVPDDLSLIGFDDIYLSQHTAPPLTTVRVDKESLGRAAVRRLHAHLAEEAAGRPELPPVRHEVPVTLVFRESCRPL